MGRDARPEVAPRISPTDSVAKPVGIRAAWSILLGMSAKTVASGKSSSKATARRPSIKRPTITRPHLTRDDVRRSVPVSLFRASHPRQAVITAVLLAGAAAVAGRPTREVVLVLATVLVGQAVLGWENDLVDMQRDRRHGRSDKPLAQRVVEPGTVSFALACGILLLIPLAVAHGPEAGIPYLVAVGVGALANAGLLRRTPLSFVPWMVSFGLLPVFLARGGWGGEAADASAEPMMVALFALLGVGAHVLLALPGLVDDNKDDFRHLPLTLALKSSAQRMLLFGGAFTAAVGVGILITGLTTGLAR